MAEYKTGVQVNYGFGLSFEASGKAPVIAKRIWETLADAQAYVDSATDTAIAGLQLTVINDTDASKNGVYFVKEAAGENGKTVGVLVKLAQNADTSDLQTQVTANKQAIDKLNGDEGATGSVKTIAKSYADNSVQLLGADDSGHINGAFGASTIYFGDKDDVAPGNLWVSSTVRNEENINIAVLSIDSNPASVGSHDRAISGVTAVSSDFDVTNKQYVDRKISTEISAAMTWTEI